jgi:hypothetical protein
MMTTIFQGLLVPISNMQSTPCLLYHTPAAVRHFLLQEDVLVQGVISSWFRMVGFPMLYFATHNVVSGVAVGKTSFVSFITCHGLDENDVFEECFPVVRAQKGRFSISIGETHA